MLALLVFIAAVGFSLGIVISLAEAWSEKAWPRKTIWPTLGLGIGLVLLIASF
jgi:hypothetical protein